MRIQGTWGALMAFAICGLSTATAPVAQEFRDGAAVLTAMHDRYANNWYDTPDVQQDSVTHNPDGRDKIEI